MSRQERDQVLDVSLRELVSDFQAAQERVATELRESSIVLSSAENPSGRLELLEKAIANPEQRLEKVRERLTAVQHVLATFIGPPPPIERDDVRQALEAVRSLDADIRRSAARFGELIAYSSDELPSDYSERIRAESSLYQDLVGQKFARTEELFSLLDED